MTPRLVLLYGPPGAGKSTLAHEEWGPAGTLSIDLLVTQLTGHGPVYASTEAGDFAWAELLRMARYRLLHGTPFALDVTLGTEAYREEVLQLVRETGAATRIDRLCTPLEVCLQRNSGRPADYRATDRRVTEVHELMSAISDDDLLREGWGEVRHPRRALRPIEAR